MTSIYEKYANLLVNYSLKLKKNDRLLILSSYLAEPLVKEVYKEAIKKGALPETMIKLNGLDKIFYDHADSEQLNHTSQLYKYAVDNFEAILNIISPFNLKELESTDPEKKKTVNIAMTDVKKTFLKRASTKDLRWTLCVFPTDSAAQESKMSLSEYENFVYKACFLDKEDPIKEWQNLHKFQESIVTHLNKCKKVQYKSSDLDITFSTEGRKWINSSGTNNMPSGEVFTSPVENSVNGHVRYSYPGIFLGQEIEDISLEVKDGEVIKWNAKKGQKLLDQVFEIPNSKYFGEVAVGTNKLIDKFTRNMLFDEKIGGTIHMALGASYPETGGKNECSIHWDLLADMSNGGEIYADGELVYKNGEFII